MIVSIGFQKLSTSKLNSSLRKKYIETAHLGFLVWVKKLSRIQ
jgi:hypothetical protein